MKNTLILYCTKLSLLLIGIAVSSGDIAFCENQEGFHIRKTHCDEERRFRDVPDDLPVLTLFPMDSLRDNPSIIDVEPTTYAEYLVTVQINNEKTEQARFTYWIHTSVSDAEIAIAESFCGSSVGVFNAVDIGREGEVGDNCWFYGGNVAISFIRNNIRILVRSDTYTYDSDVTLKIAQIIDEVIIKAEKVADVSLILAPVMQSFDIISGTPKIGEKIVLKVNTADPRGQSVIFHVSGSPGWENIIKLPRFRKAGSKTFKIWAMNEDRIVSLKEISF